MPINQRQKAIEHITELLEQLHDDRLERERNELDGCRDAIDKATGAAPGSRKGRRVPRFGLSRSCDQHRDAERGTPREEVGGRSRRSFVDDRVDVSELEAAFPRSREDGGEFRAHLELAALAIALKRRVIVLQGVEAGQSDPDNPFENFVRSLKDDQQRIIELEARIDNVLRRLSALEVRSPKRLIDKVMTRKQVDSLLDDVVPTQGPRRGVGAAAPNAGGRHRDREAQRRNAPGASGPRVLTCSDLAAWRHVSWDAKRLHWRHQPSRQRNSSPRASDASQTTSSLNSYATSWDLISAVGARVLVSRARLGSGLVARETHARAISTARGVPARGVPAG